jgi:hypothetical protein
MLTLLKYSYGRIYVLGGLGQPLKQDYRRHHGFEPRTRLEGVNVLKTTPASEDVPGNDYAGA